MRRGSVQTWEPLARRQSSNMAQFGNSRSEFMTSDLGLNDIEYERKGGFFMSHKKTAFVISAFVVIIIAAGFVGAYIGSIPKEKVYDTLALIESDVGCDHVVSSKFSLPKSLSPSRYRVELSPITEDNTVTKLEGHVTIEFQYNGTSSLPQLVLNAKHINLTRATLLSGKLTRSEDSKPRSKRSANNNDTQNLANSTLSTSQNGSPQNSTTNGTAEVLATNATSVNASNGTTSHSANLQDPSSEAAEVSSNVTENAVSTSEASTNETPVKNETREIAINRNETDEQAGFLVLYPEIPIKSGDYYLTIDYQVPIADYVIFARNVTGNSSDQWIVPSHVRLTSLVKFFPAFNDVAMKARFSLNLPRPSSMKIYSNMPMKNTSKLPNDWLLDEFEETPPIAPENVAAVVTKHLHSPGKKSIGNVTIYFWDENLWRGGAQFLMDKVEPVFQSLETLFATNLTIPKLDVIGVNHSDHNSAYPGLIMIQEALYEVKTDSPQVTKELALIKLVKLIGKQWLGGLVNSKNSSDRWIIESSLLYLQHRLMKEINAESNHSTLVMDVQPDVFEVAGYSVSRSLTSKLEPTHSNSFYTSEAYAIGACLINMLHGALRSMEFRAGYGSFVSRWSGGNADGMSFWKAISMNLTADEKPEGDFNLPQIMDLWSSAGGYPVVTVTRNYKTGSAIVHQARFSYDKPSSQSKHLWHIPLTWISENNSEPILKWIKNEAETSLQLETIVANETSNNNTWFVFNPTKSGYYRVNYDEENWKLIARALRENHEIFSPLTRTSLIDDLFSLAFVRAIPYSLVFHVIQYLPENEQEPEPWAYLLQHTIKLDLVLYDSPEYSEYHERMMKFASGLFDRVGLKIKEGSRLTMMAHQLACMFDYPAYLTWARENYAGFDNLPELPIKESVPSYLRSSLLCAFAKLNNQLSWQWWELKFRNVTNRNERNSLLSSLACFQVPSMLQAVLNEIVYSNSFDEKDSLVILDSFSIYPAAAQAALKFVESNWKNITTRYSRSCKVVTAFLDASSTGFAGEKDIEDFQSFKSKNYESLKKVGYVTALLEAKANASVSFITSLPDNPISPSNATTLPPAEIQISESLDDVDT